ncbi:MAG: helix-turn-helix domain-containing protein, partial [Clostridia bacterium]|nr:helix-turn-helix domain-containing protein [Clostridia bacterium]
MYLAENLKRFRAAKGLTQEDIANYLNITPQSVSKWEREETYPDITFLPALANILDVSLDQLIGMDSIRSKKAKWEVHNKATNHMRAGELGEAEKIYRDALTVYPNEAGMILGLAGVLALTDKTGEAITMTERGLTLSKNEKQKANMRAALCFLYKKAGQDEKAVTLAGTLPHERECREYVSPIVSAETDEEVIDKNIRY